MTYCAIQRLILEVGIQIGSWLKKIIFKHQVLKSIYLFFINRKEFEVTKMAIRIRKSKKETTQ